MRLVAVRELEAHGAQDSAGLVSGPTLQHFLVSLCLWMNPEQANTAVIRGKKSDGFEAQTAFIKVLTCIGLYFYSLLLKLSFETQHLDYNNTGAQLRMKLVAHVSVSLEIS